MKNPDRIIEPKKGGSTTIPKPSTKKVKDDAKTN